MATSSADIAVGSTELSLDSLVGYLLAAKRALSAVDNVQRANQLVTSSKDAFVQQTALTARASYLRSGCSALYSHLAQMHSQLNSIASESASEFDNVISGVSAAERRLQSTLDGLRSTIVDAKLRPVEEEPKSLLDFVDRSATQTLLDEIREIISDTDRARRHYEDVVDGLGSELRTIRGAINESREQLKARNRSNDDGNRSSSSRSGLSSGEIIARDNAGQLDEHYPSPVPAILQSMEATAHDMAENLESLVKHYDLCLEILRHTEGAGAAALDHLVSRSDLPADDQNVAAIANEIGGDGRGRGAGDGVEGNELDGATNKTDFPATGTEEHAHLMDMLASDAEQVDEVVTEIQSSLSSLEACVAQVTSHGTTLQRRYSSVRAAFETLESASSRLQYYSTQSHLQVVHLDGAKAAIQDRQTSLDELTSFYSGFLAAYDRLVIEVGRRKDVARRMKRVRDEAAARLEQLWHEDQEERELFRRRHGDFLPRDIWPGLEAPPARYDVALVEGEGSVPDISASVVQRAIRRVSARPPLAASLSSPLPQSLLASGSVANSSGGDSKRDRST